MITPFRKKIKVGSLPMELPRDMAWCFASGEYYEKNVLHWLDTIMARRPNSVLYDLGANYGYFTLRYAPICRHVYAFEPVSKTYEVLGRNVTKNHLANVTSFRVALGESPSVATIHLYSSSGNNSLFSRRLPEGHSLKSKGVEVVPVTSLDVITKEHSLLPPDVMKIDVEGAELPVILGGLRTIATHRPFIIIEYGGETCRDAGYNQEEIRTLIEENGYEVAGLSSETEDLTLYRGGDFERVNIANLVCIPRGESM